MYNLRYRTDRYSFIDKDIGIFTLINNIIFLSYIVLSTT